MKRFARSNRKANVPVCSEVVVQILSGAKEIHQHNEFPFLVLVHTPVDIPSEGGLIEQEIKKEAICLWCGGSTSLTNKLGETDNEGFQLFKQFHASCPPPKNPVGFFNAEVPRE
jgi:hypothetical protein